MQGLERKGAFVAGFEERLYLGARRFDCCLWPASAHQKNLLQFTQSLYKYNPVSKVNEKMKFNVLELYAGTGRSMEPFLGWAHRGEVGLVDNNPYAAEVYLGNRPGANYQVLDLARAGSSELASLVGGQVDVLLGCPPCQGFSDCGLKNSRDPRNRHVTKFEEVVRELNPRVVAMENVPLIAASARFERFVRALEE